MLMRRSIYKPNVFSSCWIRRYVPTAEGPVIGQMGQAMPLVPSYGVGEHDMTTEDGQAEASG